MTFKLLFFVKNVYCGFCQCGENRWEISRAFDYGIADKDSSTK